jgi:hypothetical protein
VPFVEDEVIDAETFEVIWSLRGRKLRVRDNMETSVVWCGCELR